MAQINQQPAALALTGVIGDPFSLGVVFTSISTNAASVSWDDVTNPVVVVVDRYGNAVLGGIPTITSPAPYELFLSWSAAQTSLISNAQATRWALQVTLSSLGPETLLGGPLLFTPPTWPGSSSSTTANLSVTTGTATVNLNFSITGGGTLIELTSNDGSIVIANPTGPITDISALGIAHAASVNAVNVSEGYALTTAQAASVNAVNVSETYSFSITQAASVGAIVTSEAYALTTAQAASVNAAAVSDPRGYASAASTAAIGVSETYAFGITNAASIAAISTSETYALTTAQSASVNAVNVSETYAFGVTQAASVSAEQYALSTAQAASVNAAAVSDPRGYASAASTAAISTSEAYSFGITNAASVASETYSFGITNAASIAAITTAENYSYTITSAASTAAIATSESYALTTAQAASVNAAAVSDPSGTAASVRSLALLKANNLSDVQDPGTSRSNIHVPMLVSCQTVASASVSLSAPTNGPWNGASVTVGGQILLIAQTTASQNGPYVFNGPSSALTRPTDYSTGASVGSRVVQISAGTYANTEW